MRRIILLLLCCLCLVCPVMAASGVTSAQSQTNVASDGTCQVTLTVEIKLDAPAADMVFPLPAKARDITVNGGAASVSNAGAVRNVELSGLVSAAGTYTLVFRYDLPDAVMKDKEGNLMLQLEILSGFAYPVEKLELTVTLPGTVTQRPVFTSTYYQDSIDTMMQISVTENVITGAVPGGLKDSEVLTMKLPVSEEMFPQNVAKKWSMDTVDLMMILTAALALVYWLLTLRCLPPKKQRYTVPPNGFTPGEVGCHLTCASVDFTLMVIAWAQMGYLLIHMDDNGRVLLHKRMDMGNERSEFEVKYFRKLFDARK